MRHTILRVGLLPLVTYFSIAARAQMQIVTPPPVASGCKTFQFMDSATTDGCAGAPTGTPQLPNALATYGAKRPKWSVAGVDYYVGVPSNITLKVPTAANVPAGCSFSGKSLKCRGNNLTLEGFDFSGMQVDVLGANIVVANSKFTLTPACKDPVLRFDVSANSTISVVNNSFDGGGATCGPLLFGTMIFGIYGSASTGAFEYNYFLNTPTDTTQNTGPMSGAATTIQRFNVWNGLGWQGHPDGVQLNGGNFANSIWSFNTFYLPTKAGDAGGNQPLHIEAQLTSAITDAVVSYNTIAAPGTCNGGTNWPAGCSINFGVACKWDAGKNSNTGFKAYGNYVDQSGAIAALKDGYSCKSAKWGSPLGNFDLKTGGALPTAPK